MRCIASLQNQSLEHFEILLIDNAVDEGLKRRIHAFNLRARLPVRYVAEATQGLHHARHRGAKESRSDLLIFTDDDATFSPHCLSAYLRKFIQRQDMTAAGGPIRPRWQNQPPRWLDQLVSEHPVFYPLSLMDLGPRFTLSYRGFFFGTNMAIRKSNLFEAGGFHPDSGPKGRRGDGETGLYRKLQSVGKLIGYVPDAIVYHIIPKERATLDYLLHRVKREGQSDIFSKFYANNPRPVQVLPHLFSVSLLNAPLWLTSSLLIKSTHHHVLRLHFRAALTRGRASQLARLIWDTEFQKMLAQETWLPNPNV